MDEETKRILSENYALNKENNEMLKKLVFFQKLNQIYRIVYWSIIILSAIGAMYFLKQYMGNIINMYTGGVGVSNVGNLESLTKTLNGDKGQMEDLLKLLDTNK